MDTICALASAPGRAGVAVIRLSGPDAFDIAGRIAGALPDIGRHAVRVLRDDAGARIDEALVLVFAGPRSFTGEDTVEFQTHGSPAAVQTVLAALVASGARMAEAGEFTRRALENDRLTLPQVEGLADLIEAETTAQLHQAQRVFSGQLGTLVENLRADLLRAAALTEAMIDFSDEDIPQDVTPDVMALITKVRGELAAEIEGSKVAERIRDGFEIAIVGPPNAGKSTLLNALAGRDAAIVSDVAGTTRDVIEVRMDLHGLPVTLLDTAGLRDSDDKVEKIGMSRAQDRAEGADLRVILLDQTDASAIMRPIADDIVVTGKSDLQPGDFSAVTGEGLDHIMARLYDALAPRAALVRTATHQRHRTAMADASAALDMAAEMLGHGPERIDLAAEALRDAVRRLDVLMGRMDVESVLGEIFSSFCIGK